MRLYDEFASWWPLMSAPSEYAEEALLYAVTIDAAARRPVGEVLELGSGGGNNASHLKRRYRMTLVDLSEPMLAVSRALNPECEHVAGDMRTVRLGRTFDAVLVHDAVMYMTTEQDLAAAVRTAAQHLTPGGVALFVPDDTLESYRPRTACGGNDGPDRGMRYLEWSHQPQGSIGRVSYVYAFRGGDGRVRVEHEDHEFGLFSHARWLDLIERAGLEARALPYEHSTFRPDEPREMFAGLKPV